MWLTLSQHQLCSYLCGIASAKHCAGLPRSALRAWRLLLFDFAWQLVRLIDIV